MRRILTVTVDTGQYSLPALTVKEWAAPDGNVVGGTREPYERTLLAGERHDSIKAALLRVLDLLDDRESIA